MTAAVAPGRYSILGAIVGLLALASAILPMWTLPAIFPPKPLDQAIADLAGRIEDRVAAKAAGAQYQPPPSDDPAAPWYRGFSIATAILATIALGIAVIAAFRREPLRFAAIAAGLGVGALAFQLAIAAIGAAVAVVAIFLLVQWLGIG